MGGQQVCNQACRPCNDGGVTVTTQEVFFLFFFTRKVNFWREIESEDTQEGATDVGPVKNKEKKREREGEREREGTKDQKIEVSASM